MHLSLIKQYMAVQALHWRGLGTQWVVILSGSVLGHLLEVACDVTWPHMSKQLCVLPWWWGTCYNPCHCLLDDMLSLLYLMPPIIFLFPKACQLCTCHHSSQRERSLVFCYIYLRTLFCSKTFLFFLLPNFSPCTVIVFCCLFW